MAAIFLLWVIAEIAAIWAVASLVGFLATLGLLLAGALLGSWLARREGGKAARAVMDTARAGRSPHQEVTDSMLVGLGGLLIFVPGFVSDVAGLLLLLKPTRSVVRRAWMKRLQRRGP
ncbi:FxsA family protein, partial [Streptomyces sp. GSL17-113]